MTNLVTLIYDSVREDLGVPVKLLRLLDEHPGIRVEIHEPVRVIAAGSVVAWHDWGKPSPFRSVRHTAGWLMGWKRSGAHYSSFESHCPALANFGRCDITEKWVCDIRDVSGLSSSKSKLTQFASMDDMVEKNSAEMINEINEDKLRQNLAHREIRTLHNENTSDHFAEYLWDGRVFLMNSGGSHHFAAARYIASHLGQRVPLKGKLYTYSINEAAVGELYRDFDMYAISHEAEIANGFRDAMESFKATYLWHYMPGPYDKMTPGRAKQGSDCEREKTRFRRQLCTGCKRVDAYGQWRPDHAR